MIMLIQRPQLLVIGSLLLCANLGASDSESKAKKLLHSYDLEELTEKLLEFDLNQDGQLTEMEVELQQPGIQAYLDRYEVLMKIEEEEDEEEDREREEKVNDEVGDRQKEVRTEDKPQAGSPGHSKVDQKDKDLHDADAHKVDGSAQKVKGKEDQSAPKVDDKVQTQKASESSQGATPPEEAAVEDEDDGVEIEVVEEVEIVENDDADAASWAALFRPGVVRVTGVAVAVLVVMVTMMWCFCCRVSKSAGETSRKQRDG